MYHGDSQSKEQQDSVSRYLQDSHLGDGSEPLSLGHGKQNKSYLKQKGLRRLWLQGSVFFLLSPSLATSSVITPCRSLLAGVSGALAGVVLSFLLPEGIAFIATVTFIGAFLAALFQGFLEQWLL